MTSSHRSSVLLTVVIAALAFSLASCISSKPANFRLSFLPTTPVPFDQVYEEPPQIVADTRYSDAKPNLVQRTLAATPRIPEVDTRIVKAEDRFEAGKRLYQQRDIAGARREFDAAVDMLLSAPENLPDRQRLERRLDQLVDTIYRYDLEGLGAGEARQEVVYDKTPLYDILEMTFPTDPKLRPKVKEEIGATVSQLPLEENDTVLSYIHYFSTERGRRTLINGLRRAGRYRPMVQRILDEEGLPQELIYLAQAESGFLPRARSYKAAVGMWQFVQFRGREYGLNQTSETDDRMDPERATRAAAKHLRDLYDTFGDWYLAMAAYNCGPGCVDHAVQRTGFADFWTLASLDALPKQTANYVPLILAITIMAKNPKDYNLEGLDLEQPVEYDTLEIDAPTHLALIADITDRPVSEIQDLNPALVKTCAPAGYALRVPKGTLPALRSTLDLIPVAHRGDWRIHRVARGETLPEIAHRFATPATAISAANQRTAQSPEPGDLLIIPAAHRAERATVTRTRISARRRTTHRPAASARRAPSAPVKTASFRVKHTSSVN